MRKCKSVSVTALLVLLACMVISNAQAQPQSSNAVGISGFSFQPNTLTVPAGTAVTWINDDTTDHTVTSDSGIFDSGNIIVGGQFSYIFNQPGNYPYHCKIHTSMHGMIQVTSEAETSATSNTYSAISGAIQNAISQYSQYYRMITGPAPSTQITAPQKYEATSKAPTSLYFSGQNQAVPYAQYQTYVTYTGGNSLWIQGATSWTQFAIVPQGASLSLIANTPTGGNGYLYEIFPDGRLTKNYYYFYPYNTIGFYADTIGQHILLFVINDQVSNGIVIDVAGYYTPSYQQPSYQQPSYQQPSYQ